MQKMHACSNIATIWEYAVGICWSMFVDIFFLRGKINIIANKGNIFIKVNMKLLIIKSCGCQFLAYFIIHVNKIRAKNSEKKMIMYSKLINAGKT